MQIAWYTDGVFSNCIGEHRQAECLHTCIIALTSNYVETGCNFKGVVRIVPFFIRLRIFETLVNLNKHNHKYSMP